MKIICLSLFALLGAACGGGDDDEGINSDEEARRAYLGLDGSIGASLTLGFAGFNAATSANIPVQNGVGIAGGTLSISGQVDQGSSNNKGMRLRVGMVAYTDGVLLVDYEDEQIEVNLTYDTVADVALQPALTLSLRDIPNGTLTGTLIGDYAMKGDIEGVTTLNLSFSGNIADDGTGKVIRVPGTTTVTGTAVAGDGTFEVNLQL